MNKVGAQAARTVDLMRRAVDEIVARTPVTDLHTHLFPPPFGTLMSWGIDELLTYHYLIAECLRASNLSCDQFWSLGKKEQADRVWRELFLERSPVSEGCRGVLTVPFR